MDQELIQRTRYVLRARFRRAQTCPMALFPATCFQLHAWLAGHPILAGHLHALRREEHKEARAIAKIIDDLGREFEPRSYTPEHYDAATFSEHAAACLATVFAVGTLKSDRHGQFVMCCLAEHFTHNEATQFDEALQVIRDVALDGLFEYLDECLDSRNVVLGLIAKYKQRSEWFHRDALCALGRGSEGSKRGERGLALNLYEYLLDQGVEFFVEPASASGEADVVLREPQGRYVVVDAKFIRTDDSPAEIKRKLAAGFHQVARYCGDYHEPVGHLVVFSESSRRLMLELEECDGWRFLSHGNCSIYYTEIWIADAPSASKLGKADELEIMRSDLLNTAGP